MNLSIKIMKKKHEPTELVTNLTMKKNKTSKNQSRETCNTDPDLYDLYSKFNKEFMSLTDLKTIEEKFPLKYNNTDADRFSKMMKSLYNIHQEYKDKPKIRTKNKFSFDKILLKKLSKKKNDLKNELDGTKDPELINQTPESKLKYYVSKLEKFTNIDFSEKKDYSFNASLILRNKVSNGVIILGSNNYKYKVDNLENLDTIINIIGEYPAKEFEKDKSLHFEEFKEKSCKEVYETIIVTKSGHCISCYTKPNENFSSYHYLADVIHKHFWRGDRVLVHCQMGHVRSATLMVFYLRKYFFENVNEANEFIGLKREKAGAPSMLLNNIENLVKEKK